MISLRAFDRPHSEISPSNFERVSRCTMSHRLSAGRFGRPVAGEDAALGTAAHTLLEWCLKTGGDPEQVEQVAVEGRPFRVDARMREAVGVAVDWVRTKLAGRDLLIEHKVALPWSGISGWVDVATADEPLVVVDFKHGYSPVAANSAQLGLYVLALLLERGCEGDATAVVIQPRAPAAPVRSHVWTADARAALRARLIETLIKIRRGDLSYAEGPWCRWCLVAGTCPHLRAVARDYAASTLAVPELVAAGELGAEQLDTALAMAPALEQWVQASRATAVEYCLAGGKLAGHKLVAGKHGPTVVPRADPRPEIAGLPTLRAALRSSLALELVPNTEPARGSGPVSPRREAPHP